MRTMLGRRLVVAALALVAFTATVASNHVVAAQTADQSEQARTTATGQVGQTVTLRSSSERPKQPAQHVEAPNPPVPPTPVDPDSTYRQGPPAMDETHAPGASLGPVAKAANDLTSFVSRTMRSVLPGDLTSTTNEPSVAQKDQAVFFTGNWYAARSMDGGQNWTYLDPFEVFAIPATSGDFCCDQLALYDPTKDLFIWLLQYMRHPATGNNIQRIAVAKGKTGLQNNQWTLFDFSAQTFGFANGVWLDFPHMSRTNGNMYWTTNAYNASQTFVGSVAARIPLTELAAGAINPVSFTTSTTSTMIPTSGATTTMYLGSHFTNAAIRVKSWVDGSTTIGSVDIPHTSYLTNTPYTCTSPDGTNWCGNEDDRITAGFLANGFVGFMWEVPQGTGGAGTFAYPFVQSVVFNDTTNQVVEQSLIFNNGYAWLLPSVAVNGRGDLGMTIAWGGNTFYPNSAVGVRDDISPDAWQFLNVSTGTHGPTSNRWGDYLAARPYNGNGNAWVGTSFTLQGGSQFSNVEPRYNVFGRGRDDPTVTLPAAPTLVSPAGTVGDTTPTYTWNAVSNATDYELWVNGPGGATVINSMHTAASAGCGGGTGTCSVTPTTTLATGNHTWWIRAKNGAGFGPWSAAKTFTVGAVPGQPTLVSPAGSVGDTTPTYTWNAVSNATDYQLWVNGPSGATVINSMHTAASAGCGGGTCSITPTTTLATGNHTWWIRAKNGAGFGPWSAAKTFTIVTSPPAQPTLVSPTGSVADTTPTYNWNAVSGASEYQLWVNRGSTTVINTMHTAASAGCGGGTGSCSVTPTTTLIAGAHTWWIRAKNAVGFGSWSAAKTFTIVTSPPAQPTLVSPTGSVADTTPTYTWNAVSGAGDYQLWVNRGSTTVINTMHTAASAGCGGGTGTCSITPTTTLIAGAHTWWIRAKNVVGFGPWSVAKTFTVQ